MNRAGVTFAVVTLIVLSVCFGGWWWISSLGHEAVVAIAKERGLCGDAACVDGTMHVYTVVGQDFGLSPGLIDWCVGTDDFAATRVYRGGWIKAPALYLMRLPCGQLTDGA